MEEKYLAFDLEIATIIPEGDNWDDHHPFGISCAATLASDAEEPKLWFGRGRPNGKPWDKMPAAQVRTLILYLICMMGQGYGLVTWNGLRFDCSVLAEESGLHRECVALALGRHFDPMFQFFAENGYAVSLNAAAKGMAVGQKTPGMDGAKAPVLWEAGEHQKVLDYCAQDTRLTLDLFLAMREMKGLCWRDKYDQSHVWFAQSGRLLTAREAMKLPEPSPPKWIKDPWPREHFTGWMKLGGA